MTARKKLALALALGMTWLNTHAMAEQVQSEPKDNCSALAHFNATKTANAIFTFAMPVFGKHPERWTVTDVENLMKNAKECDNKPVEYAVGSRVYYSNWRFAMADERVKRFLDLANKSTQVRDLVKEKWPEQMKIPYCSDLLKWRRDPIWLTNNSKDIFGQAFIETKDESLPILKLYVEACLPIMEGILKARKVGRSGAVKITATKITVDILSGLERDMSAQRWQEIALIPELQLVHNNQIVQLAYVSDQTRDIALKINTSEQNKIPLDIDTLSTISAWINDMNRRNTNDGPDALFVAALKTIVSRQLFQQEKRYDNP